MVESITNKSDWNEVLEQVSNFDCYHTYDYHIVSKNCDEKAILLCYRNEGVTIALPLLKRPIENTNYYDLTSVYGYVGPIFSGNASNLDFEIFQKKLMQYCTNENVISVFSRLNPYIERQEKSLMNLGDIIKLGKIVSLDLNKSDSEQKSAFSKTTKRHLNKARKFCDIKISSKKKDIIYFMELYYENMNRVNAEKFYYFPEKYFLNLLNSSDFKTEFIFITLKETGEIISGILTLRTKKTIHYHLSGTLTKYLYLNPLRLLLDEVRIMSSNYGLNSLNLGGGLGNKEDSLFHFKSSFSKDVKTFKIWKYIVNEEIYFELSKEGYKKSNFFPAYRS